MALTGILAGLCACWLSSTYAQTPSNRDATRADFDRLIVEGLPLVIVSIL